MAVKIGDKIYRNEQEQVRKNMEDIEVLKGIIKPEYTTDAVLTNASVSVALSDTNAPEGTTEGWLLTHDGLKFKITGGDDTNLLLEFYADLKGPQGESGSEGSTGPTGPAGYSIRYTSEDFVPGTTTYTKSYVQPSYQLKSNDWIVFKNGYVALISTIGDSTINIAEDSEVELDIGGGKLYQHNFYAYKSNAYRCTFTIINQNANAMTWADVATYLSTNGVVDNEHCLMASGKRYNSNISSWSDDVISCHAPNSANLSFSFDNSGVYGSVNIHSSNLPGTWSDIVFPLN